MAALSLTAASCFLTFSGASQPASAESVSPFAVKTGQTYTAYGSFEAAFHACTAEDGVYTVYAVAGERVALNAPITVEAGDAVRIPSIVQTATGWDFTSTAELTRAAGYDGPLFEVRAGASLTLEQLTVTGGQAAHAAIEAAGDLVLSRGAVVQNAENTSGAGGGIHVAGEGASVTVKGGVLTGNRAAHGAAIYAEKRAKVLISDDAANATSLVSNVAAQDRGTICADSGATLAVEGGKISAGAGNANALYVCSDAGSVSVEGRSIVTGTLYLENGATADLTDYVGGVLSVGVAEDRPDGPIVTRAKRGEVWDEIVSVPAPRVPDDYLASYAYRKRDLASVESGEGATYGYSGVGVNVSQEEQSTLLLTADFTDAAGEVSATVGGLHKTFTEDGGHYTASFELANVALPIETWTLYCDLYEATFDAIALVEIDRSGMVTAPAGTCYLAEDGTHKPLPKHGYPNDILLDGAVATFYLGAAQTERRVYMGVRVADPDPSEAAGAIYDAELTDVANTYNTLTFYGAEGFEYALLDEADGLIGWVAPTDDRTDGLRKAVFRNLGQDKQFTLLARRQGTAYNLPSKYIPCGTFKSLSTAESDARTKFAQAYRNLLEDGSMKKTITGGELKAAMQSYLELSESAEWVAKLPAVHAWLDAIRGALPAAFANDWRTEHAEILAFDIGGLNNTTHVYHRGLAEAAVLAYGGLEAHISEFLGTLAEGIDVAAVASGAQALLADDMKDNIMPKARRIADIEIEEWLVSARSKYGFADGAQDSSPQVRALNDLRDRYEEAIARVTGIAPSDYEAVRRYVDLARTKLFVQGYYERLLLQKAGAQFSREGLSEALTSVMGGLDSVTEEYLWAEYRAMLTLYQSYGKLCLDAYLDEDASEAMRALYDSEKRRIESYNLTAADDEALADAEAWVDLVVKQAETKRELQLYYEGLFDPEEAGRLNANDLKAYQADGAFETHFESWFSKIESAEDDDGRAALLKEAERDIYAELASMLLQFHYQSAYGEGAPDGMSQKYSAFLDAIGASKKEEKDIELYEDETERTFANAKLELKVLYYYKTTFADTMPATETLEAVYAAIEEAGKSDVAEAMVAAKTEAAYEGMLTLYKAYAALVLAQYQADYAGVQTQAAVLAEAERALGGVAYGELPYADASLEKLQPAVDAILEEAHQKLEVRKYYEARIADADASIVQALDSVLAAYLGGAENGGLIAAAETAEEKRAAGYAGKLALYRAYRTAALQLHVEKTYATVPADRLAALRALAEETVAAIAAVDYAAEPSDEALAALESTVDALAAAGMGKLSLLNFFRIITEEGGAAHKYALSPVLAESLENRNMAIDEATMSEGDPFENAQTAAYAAMLTLYKDYASLVLGDLQAAYPALGEIVSNARKELDAVRSAAAEAEVTAGMEEIDTLLADADASLVLYDDYGALAYEIPGTLAGLNAENGARLQALLEAALLEVKALENSAKHAEAEKRCGTLFAAFAGYVYEEFAAAFEVVSKPFGEIAAADAEALETARSAYEGMTMSEEALLEALKAAFDERAPDYRNSLSVGPYLLMLDDEIAFAKFQLHAAAALEEIAQYFADYAADAALASVLADIRSAGQTAIGNIRYEQYRADGDNADPTDPAYCDGLMGRLDTALAAAKGRIEDAIGRDEVEKFAVKLGGELAGYAHSRLGELAGAHAQITGAYAAVAEELMQRAGGLELVRAGLLEMREAYAKAVLAAYAELLGVAGDASAIEAAEDDAAKNAAMFQALLAAYLAYSAARISELAPQFVEAAQEKFEQLALAEASDAALHACEQSADAFVADAFAEDALQKFYDGFVAAQGLGDALQHDLEDAYDAIEQAPTQEKPAAKDAGVVALAKAALQKFGQDHAISQEDLAAAQTALESENADTMSEKVLSIEKNFLTEAVVSELTAYAPAGSGFAATVRTAVEAEKGKAGAAISSAATLPVAQAAYAAAVDSVAACVRDLYFDALREGLDEVNAADFANRYGSLSESGYAAVRALMNAYADVVILDARLDVDDDVALRSYQTEQLRAAAALTADASVDAFAAALPALKTLVADAVAHIRGERFLARNAYRLEAAFAEIAASDYDRLAATVEAYRLLGEGVQTYLSETYSAGYADFLIRLQDERDKAEFEKIRSEERGKIEALSGLGTLAAAAKARRLEELNAVRYLPLTDPERKSGDYLHRMSAALGEIAQKADADVRVALLKTAALEELESAHRAALNNAQVRYPEAGKRELGRILDEAEATVRALEILDYSPAPEEIAEGFETALRAQFAETLWAFSKVPVVAVAVGVDAAGNGAYESGNKTQLFGIIENDGGMSGDTVAKMQFVEADPLRADALVGDKVLKAVAQISLESGGVTVTKFEGVYIVKLLMTDALKSAVGLTVIADGGDGPERLVSRVEGEFLVFETDHFSDFYLYGEREISLWWVIFVLTVILVAELAVIVCLASRVYRKLNGKRETLAAFGLPALLAVFVPGGAVIVSVVLGVLILLAAVAIGVLLAILYRKPKAEPIPQPQPEPELQETEEPAEVVEAEEAEEATDVEEVEAPEEIRPEPAEVVEVEEPVESGEAEEVAEVEAAEEVEISAETEAVEEAREEVEILAEPAAPKEPEEPEEPEEHEETEEPEGSVTVVETIESDEPREPEEAEEPAEPEEPEGSVTVVETIKSDEPQEAEVPAEVEEAEGSEKAVEPEISEVPAEPEEVETSEEIEEVEEPEVVEIPAAPVESEEPEETDEPEAPDEPEEPETPEAPEASEEPEVSEEAKEAKEAEAAAAPEVVEPEISEVPAAPEIQETHVPVVPDEVPEEFRLPTEELREEVAASEVNALMQDTVAKQLIEEGTRVATKGKTGIVNVDTLGMYFESGEHVTLEELKNRVPYFNKKTTYVKILARGKLNKALVVEGDDFSLEAVKMIVLTGGHVIRTRRR